MAQGQSLKDRLNSLLPELLPKLPEEAIGGTELLKLVRKAGIPKAHSDDTVRSYFSWISGDPTSAMARVDQGRGYYLRMSEDVVQEIAADYSGATSQPSGGKRIDQREEKFRSLFMLWSRQQEQYPMHLEHTQAARQAAGINKWKYPDVVSVRWEVGNVDETTGDYRLNRDLLDVRRSLGEPPFRITSTELKVSITAPTLREIFFQCVSNSRWAHTAQLVVAIDITDAVIAEELRRLGTSYGVSVLSFGLENRHFDDLPNANEISKINQNEIDQVLSLISIKSIVAGRGSEILDWEHIQDLQKQHSSMKDLFSWISKCLTDCRPYKFDDWAKTMR